MPANWRFVAFPLILPWRLEFWSLPLYFPDLQVGMLRQWPPGMPYRGRPLPSGMGNGRDLRDYSPGELKQWQAYKEYAGSHEEVDDIVRALKGEKPKPEVAEGPWKGEEAAALAWRLEVMEADQESQLAKVDRGEEWLHEILAPEAWEEPESYAAPSDGIEVVDPETARRRYLLWRKEMGAFLGAGSIPLLLSCTSQGIFASLRKEGGSGKISVVRFQVPVCRDEAEFQAARKAEAASGWRGEFRRLLGLCLTAADQGTGLEEPAKALSNWLREDLPGLWPDSPARTWEMEIWGRDSEVSEGGEAFVAWGGLGEKVVAG